LSDTIWHRSDNWVGSQIEDAFVMLDIESGNYVSLNATATDVWNALETPASAATIVSAMVAQYDVPAENCAASIDNLLLDLQAKGLINSAS
jgi:hypothetical protein